ncbi:type I 3-dehydroquinate dehydratase [Calycomorphotria hydatis]|uniref:3-dehydroquinate dehydratase n=1 Tax=Calycomorphotria hydatis TaxID=2528027 RepID=A0A517TDE7_9PLAN|nr:bifunctional type I 3-dehydroquinate dehydratase/shikimate dehydrogenase [Calycomorphotria hydatis]QDT66398.1 3-dehydroquinate dehydratase [Calycomorphotria hydatis]
MICVSVTSHSRQLAKVDLFNASSQGDIVELCLDYLLKEPEFPDLFSACKKPILVSCRRAEEGGEWRGTEEERQALLRNAIVAGPDYVELELDIASKIPRFGNTKRVVSYNCKKGILKNVDDVIARAKDANADIVKFTWSTPDLNAAWPLLAAVTKKRELPVVGIGIGQAGLPFSLLAHKYGSPWVYASLEKGMEAVEGMPTIHELTDSYAWESIDRSTKFVGLTGYGEHQATLVQEVNAAYEREGRNQRVLPLAIGKLDHLPRMLDVLRIDMILVGPEEGRRLCGFASKREGEAETSGTTDLLVREDGNWVAKSIAAETIVRALEQKLGTSPTSGDPLAKRQVLLIAGDDRARAIGQALKKRVSVLNVTGRVDEEVAPLAKDLDARSVPFASVYDVLADTVILADPNLEPGTGRLNLNPGYFRPTMTVIDAANLGESAFIYEASQRDSKTIDGVAMRTSLITAYLDQDRPPKWDSLPEVE